MSTNDDTFLLAIRGTLKAKTLAEARDIHNATAGHPDGVAAARALGDLSHGVYVELADTEGKAGELLILDLWNSFEGFQKFFSDKQVQAGGAMIFESRDPTVWVRAQDIRGFTLPIPMGKEAGCVGLIRGLARSREAARAAFNALTAGSINAARMAGQISHEVFFLAPSGAATAATTPPAGQPETIEPIEILGVDVWMDADGMRRFYAEPKHLAPLAGLFVGPPITSMWKRPAGSWVEW
jgi:hypothetical protein